MAGSLFGQVFSGSHSGTKIDSVISGIFSGGIEVDSAWDDLRFPATALDAQNKNDNVPEFDTTNIGFLFDKDATEELYIIAQMPHSWEIGTSISPHIHWSASATDTVVWRLGYKYADVNSAFQADYTYDTLYANLDTADINYHDLHGFADMDLSSLSGVSAIILFRLGRLGAESSDKLNADALLREFDIHYKVDGLGSRQEYIK